MIVRYQLPQLSEALVTLLAEPETEIDADFATDAYLSREIGAHDDQEQTS